MASLNAYFAHRELEIPPSKRKSYKNLQDAANIQWHRYIKKSNYICYSLKSNTEKYKKRDALRSRFCLYLFDLCRFSADFVVCVNIYGPGIW